MKIRKSRSFHLMMSKVDSELYYNNIHCCEQIDGNLSHIRQKELLLYILFQIGYLYMTMHSEYTENYLLSIPNEYQSNYRNCFWLKNNCWWKYILIFLFQFLIVRNDSVFTLLFVHWSSIDVHILNVYTLDWNVIIDCIELFNIKLSVRLWQIRILVSLVFLVALNLLFDSNW